MDAALLAAVRSRGKSKQEALNQVHTIVPGVLLSNVAAASDDSVLHQHKVTHVVDMGAAGERSPPAPIQRLVAAVSDQANDHAAHAFLDKAPEVIAWMEAALAEADTNVVLLHCDGGISRSGAMAVAWVMTHPPAGVFTHTVTVDGVDRATAGFDDALAFVRGKRSFVCPNVSLADCLLIPDHIYYLLGSTPPGSTTAAAGAGVATATPSLPTAAPSDAVGYTKPLPPGVWEESDPDAAWRVLKDYCVVEAREAVDPATPKPPGTIRVVCVSDTHAQTGKEVMVTVPNGDILIHAGDFTKTGSPGDVVGPHGFVAWLDALPHPHKIVIAGNHDVTMHPEYYDRMYHRYHRRKHSCAELIAAVKGSSATYLEDEATTVLGYKFYGSPWQPEFCDWAFNVDRGEPCREKWRAIPSDTEILVTHGPPLGHGDMCLPGHNRAGCVDLLREVQDRIKPILHVFGHIHEGYGVTSNGHTLFANASTCNLRYSPTQSALVFDLPARE